MGSNAADQTGLLITCSKWQRKQQQGRQEKTRKKET